MTRLARFLCPTCGKQLPGDVLDPTRRPGCDECGKAAQLWEKVDSIVLPPAVQPPPLPPPVPLLPPPLPEPEPVAAPETKTELPKKSILAACLFLLAAGLLALVIRRSTQSAREEGERSAARAESARREAERHAADQLVAAKV